MDLQAFINSSTGELRFDLDTAKRAQDIQTVGRNHYAVAQCLERHLKHKAAANIESAAQAAESAPTDLAPWSGEEHPQPRSTKYARLAEGSLLNAHWDLTYYVWSIDNLAIDLGVPLRRSCRFLAACATIKAAQLYLWPPAQHPLASFSLAALVTYHAGYTLSYLLSLHLISRCRREAEELKAKTRARTVSSSDVQVWDGLRYQTVNNVAFQRWFGSVSYDDDALWQRLIDFVLSFVML